MDWTSSASLSVGPKQLAGMPESPKLGSWPEWIKTDHFLRPSAATERLATNRFADEVWKTETCTKLVCASFLLSHWLRVMSRNGVFFRRFTVLPKSAR